MNIWIAGKLNTLGKNILAGLREMMKNSILAGLAILVLFPAAVVIMIGCLVVMIFSVNGRGNYE